jgi:hypothetical protein
VYSLTNHIFEKYFLKVLVSEDTKNSSEKGTLQRFVETLSQDWDDTVISTLQTMIDNTLVPSKISDKFIPYLEQMVGLDAVHSDLTIRKKILSRIIDIRKTKGTLKSYELLFNALGFNSIEIEDAGFDFGFDSNVTLNDEVRTFDLGKCHKCKYYNLKLNGTVVIDEEMYNSILTAVSNIEPVYANLSKISVNEVGVDLLTIFVEANGDLVYTTFSNSVSFTVNSNGDLVVYGDEQDNYRLENGNLIYNG